MTKSMNAASRMGAMALAVSALVLGGGALMPAKAQAQELIIYADAYYSGQSRRLNDDVYDLTDIGMNQRISSARVVSGVWTICTRPNFGGTCQTLTGDVSNFAPTGLNDRISSIRLDSRGGGGGRGGITLFDDQGFAGPSLHLNEDVDRLGRDYDFNNMASSIRIHSGTWEFCADANYGGRCIQLSRDETNLRNLNFNNDITSLRRVDGGGGYGGPGAGGSGYEGPGSHNVNPDTTPVQFGQAYLYALRGFRGDRRLVTGEVSDMRTMTFNNDTSSIRRRGRWQVCTEINFGGRCEIIRDDFEDLSVEGLDDNISSIRPARMRFGDRRRDRNTEITLYEDVNFGGDDESFDEDVPNLRHYGFNDVASSLRVPSGRWELCEEFNYRGRCWEFSADENNLIPLGANDRISSLRRVTGGGGGGSGNRYDVTLFEHTNFNGRAFGSNDDVPNLVSVNFNDIASSLRITDGRWEFCEHTNYRGTCRTFNGDESNLIPLGLNDSFSSFRRVTGGGGGGGRSGITIYEHTNFNGRDLNFNGDAPNLVTFNFNDALSSFRIHDGTWELCEHTNYNGRCYTFSASESNVVSLGINDEISSLRRVNGGGGGGSRSEITVYEHSNYNGRDRTFTNSVDNLVGLGWNDVISSFRIRGGTWEICEHTEYGGRCQRYTTDQDNLGPLGWNDRISSIREIR